ncbi:MAG TPA: N-formylglutamate amidohydrolase [Gammaproteobacteria bacterium]|jgi:predicted N-formylglutamate amidohydrolase
MDAATRQPAGDLLSAAEPRACEALNPDGARAIVLSCDHSSNRLPRSLNGLGLAAGRLHEHIAWDIGAGPVTRLLSERLAACAVLGNYSRLVVDLNRDLDDPTAFPAISDGVLVPGNLGLDIRQKTERATALHAPYHETLRRMIDARSGGGSVPALVSIHSFTPRLYGVHRSWHVGLLWDRDPRLALPLLASLRRHAGIVVGDNEPYSGRHPADFTIDHHAEPLGLAHVGIEIRQDLIADDNGQRAWAARIAEALQTALADPALFRRFERSDAPPCAASERR